MRLVIVELSSEDPTASQVFVVRNEGNRSVDLRCWRIASATKRTTTYLVSGTAASDGAVQFMAPYAAFASRDRLTLLRPDGGTADVTPQLNDSAGDARVWFEEGGRWMFGRPTTRFAASDGRAGTAANC